MSPVRVVVIALAVAVAGFFGAVIGFLITIGGNSLSAAVTGRGLLALAAVVLTARAAAAWLQRRSLARTAATVLLGAAIGYLLNPFSWDGRAALTQLVADPGLLTRGGDLLLWMLAAWLGTAWGIRSAPAPAPPASTPYG